MNEETIVISVIGLLALMFIFQDKTNQTETFTDENQNVGSTTQTTKCGDIKNFDANANNIKTYDYNVNI